MKVIKALAAIAAVAALSSNANAELTQDTEGYQRFQLSFNAQKTKEFYDGHHDETIKTKGASVGFIKGINITSNLPLFLELGGNVAWLHNKEKESVSVVEYEYKNTFMHVSIPVQAAYKLTFSSSSFSVVPFVGPNLKFNFFAKSTTKTTAAGKEKKEKYKWLKDKNDGGGDAKIFQLGLNMGVGVNINKLYIGYTFQPDFMPFVKDGDYKVKTGSNIVTLGLNF